MSTPKRVAYVVKRYPRYSETFIVNEILAHEASGLELTIVSLNAAIDTHFQDAISKVRAPVSYLSGSSTKASSFWKDLKAVAKLIPNFWQKIEQLDSDDSKELWQAAMLAKFIHTQGITHLHAHFATSATTVARLAAKLANIPYSFTAHAKDIFHETVDSRDLERKLADAASAITVSDFNLDYLKANYPRASHSLKRIYNGLDLAKFPFEVPVQRPPVIVSVGRLVEKKGFDVLLDACAILKQKNLEFRCEIIGSGELEDPLKAKIQSLNLANEVELLGPRPQIEMIKHVQNARVFAAPCVVGKDGNRDGLPTVLLEAMALGTACISTDVTGIPELIQDNKTGLQVAQNDPQALAFALERLLSNEAECLGLAINARALIEANFDIHKNALQLRKQFDLQQPKMMEVA